jgi:hypothetical protein
VLALALGLNALGWVAISLWPDEHGIWKWVVLPGFVLLGFVIGRWWALGVTLAYGVIHAIPVNLGLMPGYLSTWGEALWWAFALTLLLALTGFGVLCRPAVRRLRSWLSS